MKTISVLFLLSLFLTSACSTTKSYPSRFYGFTPQEQALIKNGQIAVGFDEDQVRMAWGNPSRIISGSERFYYWHYNTVEANASAIQRIGNAVLHNNTPSISTAGKTVYDRVSKRVTFDSSTRKVFQFRDN